MRVYAEPPRDKSEELLQKALDGPPLGVLYKAQVIDNRDPENRGRVRVRIPQVYSGTKVNELPWASPCYLASGNNFGSYWIPEKGAWVWVSFEGGNKFNPVYIGGAYYYSSRSGNKVGNTYQTAGESALPKEVVDSDCVILYKSKTGAKIIFNDDKENVVMKSDDGTGLTIQDKKARLATDGGGKVTISDDDKELRCVYEDAKIILSDDDKNITISYGKDTKVVLEDNEIKITQGKSKVNIVNGKISIETEDAIEAKSKKLKVETTEDIDVTTYNHMSLNVEEPNNGTITLNSKYINLGG